MLDFSGASSIPAGVPSASSSPADAVVSRVVFEASTLPGVYFRQLNGRSATWVTPTFLFERRR
jgi:hypothetical protein